MQIRINTESENIISKAVEIAYCQKEEINSIFSHFAVVKRP